MFTKYATSLFSSSILFAHLYRVHFINPNCTAGQKLQSQFPESMAQRYKVDILMPTMMKALPQGLEGI